jgi:hypothetical protein
MERKWYSPKEDVQMRVGKLSGLAELNWDWNSSGFYARELEKFCRVGSHFGLFHVPFALLTT